MRAGVGTVIAFEKSPIPVAGDAITIAATVERLHAAVQVRCIT